MSFHDPKLTSCADTHALPVKAGVLWGITTGSPLLCCGTMIYK